MSFRKTIGFEDQEAIINHIKSTEPIRAWLAIKFLATYISIRPGEIISISEGQIDRTRGLIIIPHPKEKKPKIVPLTDEDIEIINSGDFPPGLPSLPFFRHTETNRANARHLGKGFGASYLRSVWKRACEALGFEGVVLYGGTKHSTAMGMREVASFEEVRQMTGHTNNVAFERYFRLDGQALKSLYTRRQSVVSADNGLTTNIIPFKKDNYL